MIEEIRAPSKGFQVPLGLVEGLGFKVDMIMEILWQLLSIGALFEGDIGLRLRALGVDVRQV